MIGALMLVLMITIAMTLVVTKYVPRWMEDNEAEHMKEVSNQFAELKYTIDTQILKSQILDSKNKETDVVMHIPIKLGTKGVPILARGSSSTLEINSYKNNFTVYNSTTIFARSMGNIRLSSNNRYFTPQDYIYENGAVIVNQSNGQIMKIAPQFSVKNESNGFSISIILIYIVGEKVVLSGTSGEEISTQIFSYQSKNYFWIRENISFAINSEYKLSWENYINGIFEKNSMKLGIDYEIVRNGGGIIFILHNIKTLNVGVAGVNTKIIT